MGLTVLVVGLLVWFFFPYVHIGAIHTNTLSIIGGSLSAMTLLFSITFCG